MKASAADQQYWLQKEQDIPQSLVDLADFGFVIERGLFKRGHSTESRCLIRPAVATALEHARDHLPHGWNFKIHDAYRSWNEQQICANNFKESYRKLHPDISDEELEDATSKMAPMQRLIMRFDKHRYGGAVDISLIDEQGADVNVGAEVGERDLEKARLLHFELRDISDDEQAPRAARRHLIQAMEKAFFDPYLAEWWHWGYNRDLDTIS